MDNETGLKRIGAVADLVTDQRGQAMTTAEDVVEMLRLKACEWGCTRIAKAVGCNPRTVRAYLDAGGMKPFRSPAHAKKLDGLGDWLRERLLAHRGNADVVCQQLATEKNIRAHLRTIERAVQPYRQALKAEALATVRFGTPPGR